jgi:hypothetical protein
MDKLTKQFSEHLKYYIFIVIRTNILDDSFFGAKIFLARITKQPGSFDQIQAVGKQIERSRTL